MTQNIKFKKITKTYQNKAKKTIVKVFEKFDFEVEKNRITCILGKSGCGKTTLLNILAGTVDFDGDVEGFDGSVSYIFQEPRLLPNLTVEQNLRFTSKGATDENIAEMLELVEMQDKAKVFFGELSGGQAQRVAIARAFLKQSQLLLMDEPFASLDTALKIRLINAFKRVWDRDKRTVLFVTHDVEEAFMLAHRVVVLGDGTIIKDENLKGEIPRKYGEADEQKRDLLTTLLQIE